MSSHSSCAYSGELPATMLAVKTTALRQYPFIASPPCLSLSAKPTFASVSVYERAARFGLPDLQFLLLQKILGSAKSKPTGSNVKIIRCCLRREIDSG